LVRLLDEFYEFDEVFEFFFGDDGRTLRRGFGIDLGLDQRALGAAA
jgi:hypothetical protein